MIARIAWKNIIHKPLNTVLSVILLTASVAIISLLILLQDQFEKKLSENTEGVDLVLGAPGSPLQLILSSVYQIDAPTGNINYEEAQVWMKHPSVKSAIPLVFGDNYKGYKIVGTNSDYIEKYKAVFEQGNVFENDFEVALGNSVANKLGLKVGDHFHGSHGSSGKGGCVHEEYTYIVKGVLTPTGRVIDNLILSNIPSVWTIHKHDHRTETSGYDHELNETSLEGVQITAVLVQFKNKMNTIQWLRLIAQNTKMQAASPIIEINRLFSLFGVGLKTLQYLAYGIMIISGISIFITLFNTLKERKYEFAILRIEGASRMQLLGLVLFESILLCVLGFILGTIVGRLALYFISSITEEQYKFIFNPFLFVCDKETYLFIITLFVGVLAALIPAIKAYKLNISKIVTNA